MRALDAVATPDAPTSRTTSSAPREAKVTLRAVALGVLTVLLLTLVVSYAELVFIRMQIGFLQMPPALVAVFVGVVGANALVRHLGYRLALSRAELLTIYSMGLLGALTASRGLLEKWIPALVVPEYGANPSNQWASRLFPHLRAWAVAYPSGASLPGHKSFVSRAFFEGLRPGERVPWSFWIAPMCAWSVLVGCVFLCFFCLAALLRRQWVEHERLTFPLTSVPLAVVGRDPGRSLFANRLTWLGFAVPWLYQGADGLQRMFPAFPSLPSIIDLARYFTSPAWQSLGYTPLCISFAAIGVLYLLPTDLLFSLWFFFALGKLQTVWAVAYGHEPRQMASFPCTEWIGYQAAGATCVLAVSMLRAARPHLRTVWESVCRRTGAPGDAGELISYRTAVGGLVAGLLGSALWLSALGLSLPYAVAYLAAVVLLIGVVMARTVAETGLLMTETSFRAVDLYRLVADPHGLGAQNLTAMALADAVIGKDQRGLLLTGLLDNLRIAEGTAIRRRSLMPAFVVALLAAIVFGGALQIWLPYRYGANSMFWYPYTQSVTWMLDDASRAIGREAHPSGPLPQLAFVLGSTVCASLAALRARFTWWPLHPIGYAVAGSWTMMVLWFPAMVTWTLKALTLRYGGRGGYLRAQPFFVGLVVGEFTSAVAWTLAGILLGWSVPQFPIL